MDDGASVGGGSIGSIGSSSSSRQTRSFDRPVPLPKAYADLFRARYLEFDSRMKKDLSINRLHRTQLFRDELAPQIASMYPGKSLDDLVRIVQRWFYNDRNRNRELWPSSDEPSLPYKSTSRRSNRTSTGRTEAQSPMSVDTEDSVATMLPRLTPQPKASGARSPASRKDYEEVDDDYSDHSEAENTSTVPDSKASSRLKPPPKKGAPADHRNNNDKTRRLRRSKSVSSQYPDLGTEPDAIMIGDDEGHHSLISYTSMVKTAAVRDMKRQRQTRKREAFLPMPEDEAEVVMEVDDKATAVDSNPLHLLSDAVALAWNMEVVAAAAEASSLDADNNNHQQQQQPPSSASNYRTKISSTSSRRAAPTGAGVFENDYDDEEEEEGEEVDDDKDENGGGKEDGGDGTDPHFVVTCLRDLEGLVSHFKGLELERTARSAVIRARPNTQVIECWSPFSRVQEHPWSIHYRNPRIGNPQLYDIARMSSNYGTDTTPHSHSPAWSEEVEDKYVKCVHKLVADHFGPGEKIPFSMQALRYRDGCRKSAHFDPAAYTVIAGLNLCGAVDVVLTKDMVLSATIKVKESHCYILWEDAVEVCKHQTSEPLDSEVRICLVLRFIDKEDYEHLQEEYHDLQRRDRIIRQRF